MKAAKDTRFLAPDFVKTGRKSRAQLSAADGTIARIGSNAVFSFDKDSRTMNLERGSVLFHSPEGKGGGTIVTNSATASVIGTTIMVSATSDGGFKLMVLEGVAKVVFPNGQVSLVKAGQMTFVLPGSTVEKQAGLDEAKDPANGSAANNNRNSARRDGRPGPVLNFDLSTVTTNSGLVGGFSMELPSAEKIRLARRDQFERLTEGELTSTGLLIVGAAGEDDFQVVDGAVLTTATNLFQQQNNLQSGLLDAATRPLSLDGTTPPENFIFRVATPIPASLLPAGAGGADAYLQGVAAGDLSHTTAVFDLGFMNGSRRVDVIGFQSLTLGNLTFQATSGTTDLRVGGQQVIITPGSTITALLDGTVTPGTATRFDVVSFTAASYDTVTFNNSTGDVRLTTLLGDLIYSGGTVNTEATIGQADLQAKQGAVKLIGTTVNTGTVANIFGATGVSLSDGTQVYAAHVDITSAGQIVISDTTVSGYGTKSVNIAGNHTVISATNINSPGLVSIRGDNGVRITQNTSVTGEAIDINSDLGPAEIGPAGLTATGSPVVRTYLIQTDTTIPDTTIPDSTANTAPSGLRISAKGVTLSADAILNAGNGSATIDARQEDLLITKPNITAQGVTLSGRTIDVVGAGGSEDAQGNITFGGTVEAGDRLLDISGTSLTVKNYARARGAYARSTTTGGVRIEFGRIEATTGVLDLTASELIITSGDLIGAGGLNVFLTGVATLTQTELKSGAQVQLNAGALTANALTVDAGTDVGIHTGGDQTWQNGSLRGKRATLAGLGTIIPGRISLSGMTVAVDELNVRAHTIILTNITSTNSATPITLRSDLGLVNSAAGNAEYAEIQGRVNIDTLTLGTVDAFGSNLVWSPEDNLGDAGAPVHILSLTAQDFRGPSAKLDYAKSIDFTETSLLRFNDEASGFALPNGNIFRQGSPALLTNEDFGLLATDVLPDIDKGGVHSPLEVKGLLARNINLAGPVSLNLAALNPIGTETNSRADIVATNSFTWDNEFIVESDAGAHRRLEIRARNIEAQMGANFSSTLPYDGDAAGDNSAVMFAAMNNFASNGELLVTANATPFNANSITHAAGSIEIGSALGDVVITHTDITAGFQSVDTTSAIPVVGNLQTGSIHLSTFAPTAKIQVTGGSFTAHTAGTNDTGIALESATVHISASILRATSRPALTAGSIPVYTSEVDPASTHAGKTDVTAGEAAPSGTIRLYGTTSVKIIDGQLVAADVQIMAPKGPDVPAGTTLEAIYLDDVCFAMVPSQPVYDQASNWIGSTGIAMEAKTINLKNITFPDYTQVRLKSQDGTLNINSSTGAAALIGAVNFSNVSIRTAGDANNPQGSLTSLGDAAGVNSKVWIQGGSAKVFFDGIAPTTAVTGTATSGAAPIHIQSIGAANQSGLHGSAGQGG